MNLESAKTSINLIWMKLTIKLNLLMGKTCPEITSTRIASLNATYIWLKSELGNKRGINKKLESMKFLITQSALETSISIFQFYPCRIFQVPYFSKYTFELHISLLMPILLRIWARLRIILEMNLDKHESRDTKKVIKDEVLWSYLLMFGLTIS